MTRGRIFEDGSRLGWVGRWLAVAALAIQLAAASVVPWAPAAAASIDSLAAASICHAGGGAPSPHHTQDCLVCPLCQAIGHAGVLLGPAAMVLAAPMRVAVRVAPVPPARAPPAARVAAAFARGPPVLI